MVTQWFKNIFPKENILSEFFIKNEIHGKDLFSLSSSVLNQLSPLDQELVSEAISELKVFFILIK